MIRNIHFPIAITFLIWLTGCIADYKGGGPSKTETRSELRQLLSEFAVSEEEKNAEAHRALYLSDAATVNFVLKNNGSPNTATLTRDQWIGFFTSWDYEYFPVYSDIEFTIKKGMALDSHLFQGFRDGEEDLFGNDLFMYVNTNEGWKIVSLSATITAPDDPTDYTDLQIGSNPETLFKELKNAFDSKDQDAFDQSFIAPNAPCFRFKNRFTENFTANAHTAGVFLHQLDGIDANAQIDFSNIKLSIKDGYTARASASYTIALGRRTIEKGNLLATFIGTLEQGWKLSAMVFSIDKSLASY